MALSGEYYDVFFVTQLTRATALAHIVAVDRVRVEPEKHSQTHRHNDAETVLFIESGSGTVVGSVAKFDFWAKSKNWVSEIQ